MNGRVLYLAITDGRGHLMRASLLRALLSLRGIDVQLVTTTAEGVAFLERLGHPATLLPGGFHLAYDDRHNLDVSRTRANTLRYLGSPRVARDLAVLRRMGRDADLLVNDSLHPALLLAGCRPGSRVVQLVGENILATTKATLDGERGGLGHTFRALFRASFDGARGQLVHSVGARSLSVRGTRFTLPPLVAGPTRHPEAVRRALLATGRPLVACYLNPHYADEALALEIERAAVARGARLYGVSEAFAHRPGWRAADPDFASVANAADALVSGAGMAAVEQSRAFGVPLVALLGTQPEQRLNAREASEDPSRPRCLPVPVEALSGFLPALDAALASGRRPPQLQAVDASRRAWLHAFESLLDLSAVQPAAEGALR